MKSEQGFSLSQLAHALRRCARKSDDNLFLEDGSALVEMALVSSLLLTMVTGVLIFGIFEMQVMALTEGVNSAGRVLAVSAGQTLDPCAAAASAVQGAAPLLSSKNLSYQIQMNPSPSQGSKTNETYSGATCSSTSTTTGAPSYLVSGGSVTVSATLTGCSLQIYGKNFMPGGCSITQSITEIVQ
jgi:Flp pilus assembly protein TadG